VSQCVGCGITYSSPVYLEKHGKYCHGLKNTRLPNNGAFCDVKHVPKINKHHGQKGYNDSSISGNMNHIKQPSIDDDTCDGISFQHTDSSKHVRDRLYQCHVYGKELTHHSNHLVHMRVQMEEKSHEREECRNQFSTKSHLSRYMRIHTREKPYESEECGRMFSQTGSLRKHMRIHTGEKPYECEECGRMFSKACSLRRHMRIHTGDKSHECEE
jgi:uncharacterized Zn-finger protein